MLLMVQNDDNNDNNNKKIIIMTITMIVMKIIKTCDMSDTIHTKMAQICFVTNTVFSTPHILWCVSG